MYVKAKYAGILSAVLGSICCVGPLLSIAIGLSSGAAFIGRYHWFFLLSGVAVLTWAWAKYVREKVVCDFDRKPVQAQRGGMLTLLFTTALVLGFFGLDVGRYIFASASAPAQAQEQRSSGLDRVVIPVEGITCVTCEIPVRFALKRIGGVRSVQISSAGKAVTVDYEATKTNPKQLAAAINSTGFRASLPNNERFLP